MRSVVSPQTKPNRSLNWLSVFVWSPCMPHRCYTIHNVENLLQYRILSSCRHSNMNKNITIVQYSRTSPPINSIILHGKSCRDRNSWINSVTPAQNWLSTIRIRMQEWQRNLCHLNRSVSTWITVGRNWLQIRAHGCASMMVIASWLGRLLLRGRFCSHPPLHKWTR